MKKYFLMMLLSSCSMVLLAQSWQTGTNVMYVNPTSTKVGIGTATPLDLLNVDGGTLRIGKTSSATDRALNLLKFGDGSYVQIGEWEANNTLSFKASKYSFNTGYLGVGVSNPEYKLDVNGKVRLKTAYAEDGWGYSYLYWDIHSLVMGTPPGHHAHCAVDLMPGGEDLNNDTLLSQFRMYSAPSSTSKIMRIYLNSEGVCWFKTPGNFGIGTSNPQYKLDVVGTIRAREIIVNTSGADFVFADGYKLRSLSEVSSYVSENKHLPDIPSASEMQQKGMAVSDLQTKLLQKVEELTLYIIEQDAKIEALQQQVDNLSK